MTIAYEELVEMIGNPDPASYAVHASDDLARAFYTAFPKLIAEKQLDEDFYYRNTEGLREILTREGRSGWERYYAENLDDMNAFDAACGECEEWVEKVFAFIADAAPTDAGPAFFREWKLTQPFEGAVYVYSMERSRPRGCGEKVYSRARNGALTAFAKAGFFDD